MAKLRDLKKDVYFLAEDLNTIVSIKFYVEGIDPAKTSDLLAKISTFKGDFLKKVNNPSVTTAKSDRKAYAKAMRVALTETSKEMFAQYSDLAEEISKVK